MNNPVISFRKSHNKTSTEYRSFFALDSHDMLVLRTLSCKISDNNFIETISILDLGIAQLLDDANDRSSKNNIDSSSLDSLNMSIHSTKLRI